MAEERNKADEKAPPRLNKKLAKTMRRVSSTAQYIGITMEKRMRKDRKRRGRKKD